MMGKEVRERIIEARKRGMTVAEISNSTGCQDEAYLNYRHCTGQQEASHRESIPEAANRSWMQECWSE